MLLQILSHTPVWVFGLFGFLLYLSWQQSKTRQVKQAVIFILPVGMLFLSFFGLVSSFGYTLLPIGLWLAGLVAVTLIAQTTFAVTGAKYEPAQKVYVIPGSWVPGLFIMAIFLCKYVVGVMSATSPEVLQLPLIKFGLSVLYGAFSGVFFARALSVYRVKHQI
ncbi:DUF6622 family protein [Neptunicella marina]|uniref:DUF1453 domain-containing protein n=1 Tax=Neptunicella marina TaxID=2125989 RepID=A0A8J6INF3_9ALTE|nr:DUF6622 family protein [Neptunicella marina]MBC3765205.1 hypothetical protein [Neptunicella marina]